MKDQIKEVTPGSVLLDDLDYLHTLFKDTVKKYSQGVEAEIAHIRQAVETEAAAKKISSSRIRDFRDMSSLLRKTTIKPEKGKRKDLKKLDLLIKDLRELADTW